MLVGLFLRHYKSYRNINFIPISSGPNFTAYLGANGAGKSSVLDALDKFFNGGEWSINMQARSEGGIAGDDKAPFVMPVFLIEKSRLGFSEVAEVFSTYMWNTNIRTTDALNGFYKLRTEFSAYGASPETHYLIAIGKRHPKNTVFLGSFRSDADLIASLEQNEITEKEQTAFLNQVIALYAYFYIPVEADASVYSALESRHVLKLLDEDIRSKIEGAITAKNVNTINASLSEFIDEISASLENYEYKGPHKNKLTMYDLVEKVFEAYFSIKILHGKHETGSLPIREMSAGEKRRALIDLAYSLLGRRKNRSHIVILAIDEPDASLHTSACHDQFTKLAEIPSLTTPKTQVLVTTHWYGFLPIVQNGIAHAIKNQNNKIEFNSFNLYNYREQIRQRIRESGSALAIDVELKSYNDMIQSIVSSVIRPDPYDWILCEGLSDKIYLEHYLQPLIKTSNLRIVPLGGFKEVKRAYEYLVKPLSDKEYNPKGKVLCLVDTDRQLPNVELSPDCKHIDFKRIIYDRSLTDCRLINVNSEIKAPAIEIEHALPAGHFLETALSLSEEDGGDILRQVVVKNEYNTEAKCSYGFLDLSPTQEDRLESFFDMGNNKVLFATQFVFLQLLQSSEPAPTWVTEIINHFSRPAGRIKKS